MFVGLLLGVLITSAALINGADAPKPAILG